MCFEMKPAVFVWSGRSSMAASHNIECRFGQEVQTPPPSSQLRTPTGLLLFSRFQGPQMLAHWHILLFILVILLHITVSRG